jgi:hypothetical protein
MLRFFRFNDPYRLLFVFIAIVLLGIKAELEFPSLTLPELKGILVGEMVADGKRMYSQVWDSMPPLTAIVHSVLDISFDRALWPHHILSWLVIFFQAAFFGILLINNKAFNESNYLPSLVFAVLCFFSFDAASLTREIIGSSLLLSAINNLLKEIEFKKQRDETIHNLGFFLGLASLSVFSYFIFFVGTSLLLVIFTRVEVRRFVLFLFGFLLPHLLLNTWYFWNDEIELLWTNFYVANMDFNTQALISVKSLVVLGAVPCLFFVFSLIKIGDGRLTKYQSQILQVMFFWLLLGLIEVYFTRQRTPQAMLVCVPPMAYFISNLLLSLKRKTLAEILSWVFVVGTIGINSFSVARTTTLVDFSSLVVNEAKSVDMANKKILVLSDNLMPYVSGQPSAFFLEWKLFRPVFEQPDLYKHIVLVAESFEKDAPDIIFDPENLMPGILKYLPDVEAKYRKEADRYVRIGQ